MKGTNHFKKTILKFLEEKAATDELFTSVFANPEKNIDDCIKYILNTVQKSGSNGFTDDEVYSMAIHYYQEQNIDPGKDINMKVVVNHTVELTEEEKKEAKEKAMEKAIDDAKRSMTKSKAKKEDKPTEQMSLF